MLLTIPSTTSQKNYTLFLAYFILILIFCFIVSGTNMECNMDLISILL